MISKITKRNGTVVDFEAEKLNRWGEWAASINVEWGSVVLGATRKCFDGCTTDDLHDAMISECVDRETTQHLKMAGRLFMGAVYKKAFGDWRDIPTIDDMYYKMVEKGLWASMDYTRDELASLNSVINHDLDLQATYTETKQIMDKYAIFDRVDGQIYESPQFVYMRMALGNMEKMPKDRRLEDVARLYKYLSEKKINAPTPFSINLGTPKKQYASCCVTTTRDTAASLAAQDHIAYMMTCASAGIGSHIKSRSKGDKVRGGLVQHMGKLPYYRVQQAAVSANIQASRGGANTMHFNVLDPELMDLLVLKNVQTIDQKKIKDIDYSAGYNEEFARRVAKNETWMLVSYKDSPELYESMYNGDQTKFLALYAKVEADVSIPKQILDARTIAIKMLTEGVETGRIYLHRTDEMNRHTPFKDTIYSSNLCFDGDTLVAVADGRAPVRIAELAESSLGINKFDVFSSRWDDDSSSWISEIKSAVAFKTNDRANVVLVSLSDGTTFKCTPNHRLALASGDYVEAQNSVGMSIEKFSAQDYSALTVTTVEDAGVSAVYDLTVDDNHNFNIVTSGIGSGILVHNCQEIGLPTKGYDSVADLYNNAGDSEIGLCSLAAICQGTVKDIEYEDVAYYALLMIDNVIDIMEYPFAQLETTAKARRSAGVGITNLAFDMASRGLKYSSLEGKQYIHRMAEQHSFYLHKASLRLAKERGVCEWINKTKYPDGWLPIDTASTTLDPIINQPLMFDWESLRSEMIIVGGLRNSVLEAHMPCESSSVGSGTTNGLYPIRAFKVVKTSGTNKILFIAPELDTLKTKYELAWDIPTTDIMDMYAIVQKFTGQGISADIYIKYAKDSERKVSVKDLLTQFLYMTKVRMKSRYYINSSTGVDVAMMEEQEPACDSCSL